MLSIQPQIPEISVRYISNGTDYFESVRPEYFGPPLKVVHFDRSCPFDKIIVPSTALLYPACKNNNRTTCARLAISSLSLSLLNALFLVKPVCDYLTGNGLLPDLQSAYRKHYSTETALTHLTVPWGSCLGPFLLTLYTSKLF